MKDKQRTINTSGTATVRVKPDSARVFFGVQTIAPTIKAARTDNADRVKKVMEALNALNVPDLKMKTSDVSVDLIQTHKNEDKLPQVLGYRITNTFTVLVRNDTPAKLSAFAAQVLDTALENGATNVQQIVFFKGDLVEAQRQRWPRPSRTPSPTPRSWPAASRPRSGIPFKSAASHGMMGAIRAEPTERSLRRSGHTPGRRRAGSQLQRVGHLHLLIASVLARMRQQGRPLLALRARDEEETRYPMRGVSRCDFVKTGSLGLAALGVGGLILRADAQPTPASGELGAFAAQVDVPAVKPADKWQPTEDNILGPFYRAGAPYPRARSRRRWSRAPSWSSAAGSGGFDTRKPLAWHVLDIWQANANGRYDNDDPKNPPAKDVFKNRRRLITDENGYYEFETIHPAPYKIGPKAWRPSHVHYLVRAGRLQEPDHAAVFQGRPTQQDRRLHQGIANHRGRPQKSRERHLRNRDVRHRAGAREVKVSVGVPPSGGFRTETAGRRDSNKRDSVSERDNDGQGPHRGRRRRARHPARRLPMPWPGYEVAEAADGVRGLEEAVRLGVDLVLLDLLLPKKDGLEVLAELREDPAGPAGHHPDGPRHRGRPRPRPADGRRRLRGQAVLRRELLARRRSGAAPLAWIGPTEVHGGALGRAVIDFERREVRWSDHERGELSETEAAILSFLVAHRTAGRFARRTADRASGASGRRASRRGPSTCTSSGCAKLRDPSGHEARRKRSSPCGPRGTWPGRTCCLWKLQCAEGRVSGTFSSGCLTPFPQRRGRCHEKLVPRQDGRVAGLRRHRGAGGRRPGLGHRRRPAPGAGTAGSRGPRSSSTSSFRVALWRLDSRIWPALAKEDSRPYNDYSAVYTPPLAWHNDGTVCRPASIVLPSPLLHANLPAWMLLHFHIAEEGKESKPTSQGWWGSPQVLTTSLQQRLGQPEGNAAWAT